MIPSVFISNQRKPPKPSFLSSSTMRISLALSLMLSSTLFPSMVEAGRAAGEYEIIQPNSLASAMMMGLINQDKVENNRARLDGSDKPVWGAIMSLGDNTVRGVDVNTNTFCASGGTLGNGSWAVFGGNQAASFGGAAAASQTDMAGPYQDADGRKAIRLLNPADDDADLAWIDTPGTLEMQTARWYPGVEVLADGSIVLIGGATGGGYINRNYPNLDPGYQGTPGMGSPTNIDGGANPTYETYPSTGPVKEMQFMITTSGLNMYPHTYLMPSGKIFVQANYSTILWDHVANTETPLPDMPDQVIRVYPASGAAAMLPLNKDNNFTPTILFCGGTNGLSDSDWGSYSGPGINILDVAASTDCSSITPENADGTLNTDAAYDQEEQMDTPRQMGQFVHLPTGQMVILNGASKGTAGYYNTTFNTLADGTLTEGLAQEPTYQPVIYDPSKPKGSRLSSKGLGSSTIARLYHSSAILLPDGSVLVGGSNPHQDVALTMPVGTTPQAWNTTYELEKWYPPYYFLDRPGPQGLPDQISYGGASFNVTMDGDYMGDSANYKANHTKFMIIRPGFSTHAMNMGQRSYQLEHTYTVNEDASVEYEVNPMGLNTNLVVPGPALLFVTINGIPSVGKFIQVGDLLNKDIPAAVTVGKAPSVLAAAINNPKYDKNPNESALENFGIPKLIAIIAAVVVVALIVIGVLVWKKRVKTRSKPITEGASTGLVGAAGGMAGAGGAVAWANRDGNGDYRKVETPASSIHHFNTGNVPNQSTASLGTWDAYKMQDVGTPPGGVYDNPMGSSVSLANAGAGAAAGGALAAGGAAAPRARSPLALKPSSAPDDGFGGGGGSSVHSSNYNNPTSNFNSNSNYKNNDSNQQQYQEYHDNSFGSQSNSGNYDQSNSRGYDRGYDQSNSNSGGYDQSNSGGYDQSSYSNQSQSQQQQGWGEHQAGDAGEYYQDNTDAYQSHSGGRAVSGYAAAAYVDEVVDTGGYDDGVYDQNQDYSDPYSNDQYYGGGGGNQDYGSGTNSDYNQQQSGYQQNSGYNQQGDYNQQSGYNSQSDRNYNQGGYQNSNSGGGGGSRGGSYGNSRGNYNR